MARLALFLLSAVLALAAQAAASRHTRTDAYVHATCARTRFPELCVRTLKLYARKYSVESPEQLAQAAVRMSLYRAVRTRWYMIRVARRLRSSNAREYAAAEDCRVQITDSVLRLGQAVRELKELEQEDDLSDQLGWHVSNVETWMSSALTDASTCVAQIEESGRRTSRMKAAIKAKAKNVAEVTSNALALFQQYTAARYRARAAAHKA